MSLSDNKRLYDISTRHQMYVEGVKVWMWKDFNKTLLEINTELKRLLGRIKYTNLDSLTKVQLNSFILELRKSQSKIYSAYVVKVIKQLHDFMQVDLEVNRIILAQSFIEEDEDEDDEIISDFEAKKLIEENKGNNGAYALFGLAAILNRPDLLWSNINNAPIPANGLFLVPFVKTFVMSAQAGVENIIRKGWANKQTVVEITHELTELGARQGTASQIQRISVQANAVIATAVQHTSQLTSAAVGSSLYAFYGWFSVMDAATTDICRSRNLKVYRYGAGPLPPAHIGCRSHIAPIVGTGDIPPESFYTWMRRQPNDIQNDLLGQELASQFRDGKIKAADMTKYDKAQTLDFDEFKEKIKLMLTK